MSSYYEESGYRHTADSGDTPSTPEIMLGGRFSELPNLVRFMNPIDQVHPGMPPVLSQHGRYDPLVAYQHAVDLTEKIRAVAGEDMAELDLQEDYTHADLGFATPEEVDRIFTFLDRYLK